MKSLRLHFLILCYLYQNVKLNVDVRKFIYKKDMSEHCRRQVMTSVFLGKHSVVANSQVLHFTSLEVPYSCFITIRAESGSNIVLVFELGSDYVSRCDRNKTDGTVVVYELAETFGGYWGPMPSFTPYDEVFSSARYYKQKTAPADGLTPGSSNDDSEDDYSDSEIHENEDRRRYKLGKQEKETEEPVLVYEIPILKATSRIIDTNETFKFVDIGNSDEQFDYKEISIKRGQTESTTIMPLLQFSRNKPANADEDSKVVGAENIPIDQKIRESELSGSQSESRYQLDFNVEGFTFDPRLLYTYDSISTTKKTTMKYGVGDNKIIKYKKRKKPLFSPQSTTASAQNRTPYRNDTWSYIEALLKNASAEGIDPRQLDKEKILESEKFAALMQKLVDWQQNYSIYLASDLSNEDKDSFDHDNTDFILRVDNSSASATTAKVRESNPSLTPTSTIAIQSTDTPVSKTDSNAPGRSKLSETDFEFKPSKLTFHSELEMSSNSNITNPKLASEEIPSKTAESNKSSSIQSTTVKTTIASPTTTTPSSLHITTKITELALNSIHNLRNLATSVTEKLLALSTTKQNDTTSDIEDNTNFTSRPTITSTVLSTTQLMGTIVNRESWENVVQVAPKIAGLLTDPVSPFPSRRMLNTKRYGTTKSLKKTKNVGVVQSKSGGKRRKRSIQAIQIDLARPHNQTTVADVATTPEVMYRFLDMIDFASLVELKDDDIYGRISMFNMKSLVGAKLLDLCHEDNKTRIIHLFNTSRIAISLNDFTWSRMSIIATPVRTLTRGDMRCDRASLECQVSGARVCIDKLNICDGIPNCGISDIYDEDRMLCGGVTGLQHSVYLAAFTFLAVLITLLYILYFWLKRCVPKVSEAFFIYTDGTENVLRLEPIMKSPLLQEDDLPRQLVYESQFLEADIDLAAPKMQGNKKSFFSMMFSCCRKRQLSQEFLERPLGRLFSFPENEIHNMVNLKSVEAAVQTGVSLEMNYYINDEVEQRQTPLAAIEEAAKDVDVENSHTKRKDSRDELLFRNMNEGESGLPRSSEDSELGMLKFFKDARLSSMMWNEPDYQTTKSQSMRPSSALPREEKEVKSTMYGRSASLESEEDLMQATLSPEIVSSILQQGSATSFTGTSGLAGKRLRFNDNLTTISNTEDNEDNRSQNLSETEIETSGAASSGRDFMRFWSKKSNKKKPQGNK